MTEHNPIPVTGYRPQGQASIDMVNANKAMEEQLLRVMDGLAKETGDDGKILLDLRWLAIARTNIEQGFMALNRAIFKPERVKL